MQATVKIYRVTFFDMQVDTPAATAIVRAIDGPQALLRAYVLREGKDAFQLGECDEIAPDTWGVQILQDGDEVASVVVKAVQIGGKAHGLH